jgi:hypothetical protein
MAIWTSPASIVSIKAGATQLKATCRWFEERYAEAIPTQGGDAGRRAALATVRLALRETRP